VRAGQLRNRIEIQAVTQTQDANTGAVTDTWTTVATRWGSITPLEGSEAQVAAAQEGKQRHLVGMRFYAGLTTKHRLKFGSMILNVDAITVAKQLDVEMEIMCWEQV
jgi:SPP1 family predicted phage head-tail adaptor